MCIQIVKWQVLTSVKCCTLIKRSRFRLSYRKRYNTSCSFVSYNCLSKTIYYMTLYNRIIYLQYNRRRRIVISQGDVLCVVETSLGRIYAKYIRVLLLYICFRFLQKYILCYDKILQVLFHIFYIINMKIEYYYDREYT